MAILFNKQQHYHNLNYCVCHNSEKGAALGQSLCWADTKSRQIYRTLLGGLAK